MSKKIVYGYLCINPFTTSKNAGFYTIIETGKKHPVTRNFNNGETISIEDYNVLEESDKLNFKPHEWTEPVDVYFCTAYSFTASKVSNRNYITDSSGKKYPRIFHITETISEEEYNELEESDKLNFRKQKYDGGDGQPDYSMFDGDPLYNEDAGGNYNEGDGNSYPDYD